MSESYEPQIDPMGGPAPRPDGDGIPPKTGGGMQHPGQQDSVDTGMDETDDRGEDTGGMLGEG